jgi:hypothetical protein
VLDEADTSHFGALKGLLFRPLLPCAQRRIARLEHEPSAGTQRASYSRQRREPLIVGEEDLSDVGGHHHQVDREIRNLPTEVSRVAADPLDPVSTLLSPRHVERRRRGIKTDDVGATLGEHTREGPGAAADVKHCAGTELINHCDVVIEVGTIRVECVVDRGEPEVVEDRVGHCSTVGHDAARSALRFPQSLPAD